MFFGCNWKWFEHWFSVESNVHTCIQWKRDSFQYPLKSRLWIQYKFSSSFLFQVEATSPSVLAGETNQTLPSWWCWRGCWGCWHSNCVLFTDFAAAVKKRCCVPSMAHPKYIHYGTRVLYPDPTCFVLIVNNLTGWWFGPFFNFSM